MEVYPEEMDGTHYVMRYAHDAVTVCTVHFRGTLPLPTNYKGNSLNQETFEKKIITQVNAYGLTTNTRRKTKTRDFYKVGYIILNLTKLMIWTKRSIQALYPLQ